MKKGVVLISKGWRRKKLQNILFWKKFGGCLDYWMDF